MEDLARSHREIEAVPGSLVDAWSRQGPAPLTIANVGAAWAAAYS